VMSRNLVELFAIGRGDFVAKRLHGLGDSSTLFYEDNLVEEK
jgi:hypothetical protein